MNSPATIEAEASPETLLVEETLPEESLADGEPPVLTEEATPEVAFSRRPDRLLRALIYGSVLVVGVAGGAVMFHVPPASSPDEPAVASPASGTVIANPEDAAASANRKQIEDVAAAAEGSNEPPANPPALASDKPEQTPPVAQPIPPTVVPKAPMTALEAAVAAERARPGLAQTAHQGVQSSQHQTAAKPVKTAECSLVGDDMATFRKCVEKFNR
jgi:hypothetical protein